jgi:transposase
LRAALSSPRRLVARRDQVVRHRTRVKNEAHGLLAAHLVPPCPHVDPFNGPGRAWLDRQALPDDERAALARHLRELERLGEDLAVLDRAIGEAVVDHPGVRRLLTIAGVNVTVAAGLVAAIGDVHRFSSPQARRQRRRAVSCFRRNPRVRQAGPGSPSMAGSARSAGRTRAMLVETALAGTDRARCARWAAAKAPGPRHAFFVRLRAPRPSGRGGGDGPQDGGAGLASADQGGRLPLGRPAGR